MIDTFGARKVIMAGDLQRVCFNRFQANETLDVLRDAVIHVDECLHCRHDGCGFKVGVSMKVVEEESACQVAAKAARNGKGKYRRQSTRDEQANRLKGAIVHDQSASWKYWPCDSDNDNSAVNEKFLTVDNKLLGNPAVCRIHHRLQEENLVVKGLLKTIELLSSMFLGQRPNFRKPKPQNLPERSFRSRVAYGSG